MPFCSTRRQTKGITPTVDSNPHGRFDPAIPNERWRVPDGAGFYNYLPPEADGEIIVFEPPAAGKKSYVILESGEIELWSRSRVEREIKEER